MQYKTLIDSPDQDDVYPSKVHLIASFNSKHFMRVHTRAVVVAGQARTLPSDEGC